MATQLTWMVGGIGRAFRGLVLVGAVTEVMAVMSTVVQSSAFRRLDGRRVLCPGFVAVGLRRAARRSAALAGSKFSACTALTGVETRTRGEV